jgi:hypothetical protein
MGVETSYELERRLAAGLRLASRCGIQMKLKANPGANVESRSQTGAPVAFVFRAARISVAPGRFANTH